MLDWLIGLAVSIGRAAGVVRTSAVHPRQWSFLEPTWDTCLQKCAKHFGGPNSIRYCKQAHRAYGLYRGLLVAIIVAMAIAIEQLVGTSGCSWNHRPTFELAWGSLLGI